MLLKPSQLKQRAPGRREVQDASVPEGFRIILSPAEWQKERAALCDLAKGKCERCGRTTPLRDGEAHHRFGRGTGGGKRTDEVWRLTWTGKKIRNLEWLCRLECHPKAKLLPLSLLRE